MTDLLTINTRLQQAGAKTHEAMTLAQAALQQVSAEFTTHFMGNPSAAGNDALYRKVKDLDELARTLEVIEKGMVSVYEMSREVAGVTQVSPVPVAIAGPARTALRLAHASGTVVEESVPKMPKSAKAVWSHVKTHLNLDTFTVLTQESIATGSGIPQGTVGAALKRLKTLGLIEGTAQTGYKITA